MIKIRPIPPGIDPFSFSYLTATWFHSGRLRPVSGTWGSLAAIPFCWLVSAIAGPLGLAAFALLLLWAGLRALKDYLPRAGQIDPSEVVIDEVIGMAIMWMFLPYNGFWPILFGFVLFRAFDAIKIGPVGWCDKNIKGPLGVIADDMVAGLLAGLTLFIVCLVFQVS